MNSNLVNPDFGGRVGDDDGIWLDTDYETEGVLSLEFAVEQLGRVLDDTYRWKWAIIGVHNSLQAFMVVACSGSDQLGAMTDSYRRHWYEHYKAGTTPTHKPRLAPFMTLFDRVQNLKRYVDTQSLEPTGEQSSAVKRLNSWRDDFVHYKPGSLTIEVSGFPDIVLGCMRVIDFITFGSMNVFRGTGPQAKRTRDALDLAYVILADIREAYAPRPVREAPQEAPQ